MTRYTLKIYVVGKWIPIIERYLGGEGVLKLRARLRPLSDQPVIQDEGKQLWRAVRWFKVITKAG